MTPWFRFQVLALILLHIRPSDRLNSALTCRRWAKVMSSSDMLKDIRLDLAGREMDAAASLLSKSTRQHRSLLLFNGIYREFRRCKEDRELRCQVVPTVL